MISWPSPATHASFGRPALDGVPGHSKVRRAGVKLLQKAAIALNGLAVSYRVNREITQRADQIRRQMPKDGGVLLCVGMEESELPDPMGTRMFLSLHIAGAGKDPRSVFHGYLTQPRLVQGPAEGWRRRDEYIWVTSTSR